MNREFRILDSVLAAYRNGDLHALCARRPQAAIWFLRRFAHPFVWQLHEPLATHLGDAIGNWLRWGILRCSGLPGVTLDPDRRAWLGGSASRPYVAFAAHYGFLQVPEFPERYCARRDEPPFERICGLWGIAPSSFYRYVERGKRKLAAELFAPLDRNRASSMCEFLRQVSKSSGPGEQHEFCQLAAVPRLHRDLALLWRAEYAGNHQGLLARLRDSASSYAAYPMIDALLDQMQEEAMDTRCRVSFRLARARVAQLQNRLAVEERWISHAFELASSQNDPLSLSRCYAAKARGDEASNVDRAMADYREAIALLDQVCAVEASPALESERVTHSIRLAWLYIQRNDPTAAHIVSGCEERADRSDIDVAALASLAQARAELARRSGHRSTAVDANLRALQYYERLGNVAQANRVCATLVLLYGELREIQLAERYAARVINEPAGGIDAHTLAATKLNLGVAYFWSDRLDDATEAYRAALALASRASLQQVAGRAHFNIAEALYRRFMLNSEAIDEHFADAHAKTSLEIWLQLGDKAAAVAARNLKSTVLGLREHLVYDRLLPGELAAHFDELSRIAEYRKQIESCESDERRALAHLAVAREYLGIAVKERERALRLSYGKPESEAISSQLRELAQAFQRSLSLEEALVKRWADESKGIVPQSKLADLAKHLARSDTIKKSTYASICAVSPATASKHLALLAQSGLLVRANRGRATLFRRVDPP